MLLNRKSVELLAPAGTWDALVAGVLAPTPGRLLVEAEALA